MSGKNQNGGQNLCAAVLDYLAIVFFFFFFFGLLLCSIRSTEGNFNGNAKYTLHYMMFKIND